MLACLLGPNPVSGQTIVDYYVRNDASCDLRMTLRITSTNCNPPTGAVTSCFVASGQDTQCTFTIPAGHTICDIQLTRIPVAGATPVFLPCAGYHYGADVDLCSNGTSFDVEMSDCYTFRIFTP